MISIEEEQNMPPRNMVLCYIHYFEQYAFEKLQMLEEAFFEVPLSA